LKAFFPQEPTVCSGETFKGKSKLEILLGKDLVGSAAGRTVIDFGCGEGHEAIELAKIGAERVIGLDIREEFWKLPVPMPNLRGCLTFVSSGHLHKGERI